MRTQQDVADSEKALMGKVPQLMQQTDYVVPKQLFERRITIGIRMGENWKSGSVMNEE